jgi:hypothetical protein
MTAVVADDPRGALRARLLPTSLDTGIRSPKKLLRAVVARLLGRKAVDRNA